MSSGFITQTEVPGAPHRASIQYFSLRSIDAFDRAIRGTSTSIFGIAIGLPSAGTGISSLALASKEKIFLLTWDQMEIGRLTNNKLIAIDKVFSNCARDYTLAAFDLAHLLVQCHFALQCHLTGVDLSTAQIGGDNKLLHRAGGLIKWACPDTSAWAIDRRWDTFGENGEPDIALRAWFTAITADLVRSVLDYSPRLTTTRLERGILKCLEQLVVRTILMDAKKPRSRENDFSNVTSSEDGNLVVQNSRYKTRIRQSSHTLIEMQMADGASVVGHVSGVKGKQTTISANRGLQAPVNTIRILGKEELTCAEQSRYRFLTDVLQGDVHLHNAQFIELLWFPGSYGALSREYKGGNVPLIEGSNMSQSEVVAAMRSESNASAVVVVHGPPGTGKTTTIANTVAIWRIRREPVWIVAQSNVAVKNIAESLCKKSIPFQLVVSKEFYVEWHEDIYEKIQDHIVRTDDILPDPRSVASLFSDTSVVLCTLSTLSNPKLDDCGLFKLIPVERLVVDEASQIDVFEYLHILHKFRHSLIKLCFFGDPKQLPPYGAEHAGLQTVFDLKHLRKIAYFLNTQYRMPECFGEFISGNVYDDKLLSVHPITDTDCVRFVDVAKGQEQADGSSWKNMEEVHTIVRLIRFYYQHTDFCVITPYDAQRAAIVRTLEAENLPSNRVFNVDSFQGNEADFVILTPVRTNSAGFLNSKQRMNVALTRFKKGMVIVTNECFVSGAGQNTLLGRLAAHWEKEDGDVWTDWTDIVNQTADMPGVCAPRVRPPPAFPSQSDFRNGADRTVSPVEQRVMRSRVYGSDSADSASISARTTPELTRNPTTAVPSLSDLQGRIDQTASLLQRKHDSAPVRMTSHDAFPALPSSTVNRAPVRPRTTVKPVQGCWGDTRKLASVKDSSTASAQRDEVDELVSAFGAMNKKRRATKQRR